MEGLKRILAKSLADESAELRQAWRRFLTTVTLERLEEGGAKPFGQLKLEARTTTADIANVLRMETLQQLVLMLTHYVAERFQRCAHCGFERSIQATNVYDLVIAALAVNR